MDFFDQSLVDKFSSDYGSTIKLYKLSEMFNLFKIKSRSYRTFLSQIIKDSCAANIGDNYRNNLSASFMAHSDKFDFIAVASSEIKAEETAETKYNKIQGFMIVEKGECQTYPDNYCVNLICTRSSVGNILMALYIYIIIQRDDILEKIGLLELANAYFNVGGLCLYAKYNFKFDPHLSNDTCFRYFTPNLPMIANIQEYGGTKDEKTARLMDILKNNKGSFDKPSICAARGIKQKLLGLVSNLHLSKYVNMSLKMGEQNDVDLYEYVYGLYTTPQTVTDGTEIDYKLLLKKINNDYGGVDNFIDNNVIDNIDDTKATELVELVVKPPIPAITVLPPPPAATTGRPIRSTRSPIRSTRSSTRTTPFGGKRRSRRKNKSRKKKRTKRRNKKN
jgi:hypothetical protein